MLQNKFIFVVCASILVVCVYNEYNGVKIPFNIDINKMGLIANNTDVFKFVDRPRLHYNVGVDVERSEKREIGEGSKFSVRYFGNPPEEFVDVIEGAVGIWADLIENIRVPIVVYVYWTPISNTAVLGAAGPRYLYLYENVFYCDAMINQLLGRNQNPADEDIVMYINSDFRGTWYFGGEADGNPPAGHHDLLTVVLHELAHGLGVVGLIDEDGKYNGDGEHLYVYDRYILDSNLDYIMDSQSMQDPRYLKIRLQQNSNNLYFYNGAQQIYNPTVFSQGSSLYHLDEHVYTTLNSKNSLLTPYLNSAERILSPGMVGMMLMNAVGWRDNLIECSEYASNCETCVSAACAWCGNQCVNPLESECDFEQECGACRDNTDCNDTNDMCRIGTCDSTSGQCEYTAVQCISTNKCEDETGTCYSDIGCVYRENGNCNEEFCNVHFEIVKSTNRDAVTIDNNSVQRSVTFPVEYSNWVIESITVTVVFQKINGDDCVHPGNGSIWPNEIYMTLITPDQKEIRLITVNTFVSGSGEEYTLVFDDSATHKVVSIAPKSGTFLSVDPLNTLVHGKYLTNRGWKLVIGDSALHDVLCFKSFSIEALLEPLHYQFAYRPQDVLCSNNTDTLSIDSVQIDSLEVPIHFFELDSMAYAYENLEFTPCTPSTPMKIQRKSDLLLTDIEQSVAVDILLFKMCYSGLQVYRESLALNELWDISLSIDTFANTNTHVLTLNTQNKSFRLQANVTVQLDFYNRQYTNVHRQLKYDKPPNQPPLYLSIDHTGSWQKLGIDSILFS